MGLIELLGLAPLVGGFGFVGFAAEFHCPPTLRCTIYLRSLWPALPVRCRCPGQWGCLRSWSGRPPRSQDRDNGLADPHTQKGRRTSAPLPGV